MMLLVQVDLCSRLGRSQEEILYLLSLYLASDQITVHRKERLLNCEEDFLSFAHS